MCAMICSLPSEVFSSTKKKKTQALEVQLRSLPACESFILRSCSPRWLSALHLYTVQSHNAESSPPKPDGRLAVDIGWSKLNHSLWLLLLYFIFFLLFMAHVPPFVAIWKASIKETAIRKKKKKIVSFRNWKTVSVFIHRLLAVTMGSPIRGQLHQLLWMCSVCECAPVRSRGDATLIQSEVRIYQRAWPLTRYKAYPFSPRLYCAYLLISLSAK